MREVLLGVCICMMLGSLSCNDDKQVQSNPPDQTVREPDLTGGSSVAATPRMRIEPPDLTSSVGTTPLRFMIDQPPHDPLDASELSPLEGLVGLRTYPDDAVVSTTPKLKQGGETTSITLVPTKPLGARWYALVVSPAAGNLVRLPDSPWAAKSSSGRVISRFHPSTHPTVRMVAVGKKDFGYGLAVDFSERVVFTKNREDLFDVNQGGKSICTPFEGVFPSYSAFMLSCPGLDLKSSLTLRILPGIVSNTSAKVPLAEVDGTPIKPITFVPAQLPQEAPGVYHWVPPLL